MLASALRRLDNSADPDHRVYAVETRAGARKYTVMSPQDAWERTKRSAPAHLYEVLCGPCNLYLDIEWYCDSAPTDERDVVDDVVKKTCASLERVYRVVNPVVTSVSASGAKGVRYKCSWHVHIQCANVCWLNALAVGHFVRSACADMDVVDKVPYAGKGQNWRCVGSAKYAEPSRAFCPADEHTFMKCTVQHPVNDRCVIYPDAALPVQLAEPVPEHIRNLASTLGDGGDPMLASPTRCIVPFRTRQYCEHAGRYHRSNHQYAVINTETLMWKMKCHACTDNIGIWRPFDNAIALEAAYNVQVAAWRADAPEPAVKSTYTGTCVLDDRAVGPPAPGGRHRGPHLCRDGMYTWH